MSYIGRGTDKISNIEILDNITFDGSSSYSITKSSVAFVPNSAQSLLISIDGVVQATNFTISSSTIDFGVAVPSTSTCDFFLHYGTGLITTPADGTVSLDKLSATGTKDATTFLRGDNTFDTPPLGGITEADQWRINADSNTGSNTFVTANWERNDTSGFSKIGTGLSESSGVFSFASTGIYLITFYAQFEMEAGDGAAEFIMHKTTDNSTYAEAALALAGNDATSGGAVGTAANSFMFDVTDTSTHKFKFKTGSMGGSTFLLARTNYNATGFTMTRLGDT